MKRSSCWFGPILFVPVVGVLCCMLSVVDCAPVDSSAGSTSSDGHPGFSVQWSMDSGDTASTVSWSPNGRWLLVAETDHSAIGRLLQAVKPSWD
jgi:hypothetical protein